ncbi:hypothetical protein AN641_00210 [Candidatus Epulonipiscioides gigas]|nr:hypothetical protein AN641_00210 [Epulopiscium sp. SCG-C07WGA-EpuloA2]
MKNSQLKSVAIVMSLVIGAAPVFACNSAPRANTTRSSLIEVVPTTATVTPAPSTTVAPSTTSAPSTTATQETKEETKQETKKEEAKKTEETREVKKDSQTEKKDVKDENAAFTIDNFKIIQASLITLGIKQEDLEIQIKEGKKLVDVLEQGEIPVKKFKKQLVKEYSKAIKEGQKEGKLTKEEAKTLKKAIKEKVDGWMTESK